MSHLQLVTGNSPVISHQEMMNDHKKILQNHLDRLRSRGYSERTMSDTRWFNERWFEKIRVRDENGERQLVIQEAMNLGTGRARIKDFLLALSTLGEDGLPCVRHQTARAYASHLERLFLSTCEFPYIEGLQTISSKYGPIENPFIGVEYPIHSRDLLRAERFFLTPAQILELLVFLLEVYPFLTKKPKTAGRMYAIIMLITETGMRANEILNLDALGDNRDIFYHKKIVQTRYGKGCNSSGHQTRLMPLTEPALITLKQYELEVRPRFRNHLNEAAMFLTSTGNRLSYSTLRNCFALLIEEARMHGVDLPPMLTIHDLRASFATNFIEENPDQFWELMERLGHVSPSSTHLYIRFRAKDRWASMKEARRRRPSKSGFGRMVYNTQESGYSSVAS
jgi:integrase